jgi:hypothetical protein
MTAASACIVIILVSLGACTKSKNAPPRPDSAAAGTSAATSSALVAPPRADTPVTVRDMDRVETVSALDAVAALGKGRPDFVPFRPADYPFSVRQAYLWTENDSLSKVRANLHGTGPADVTFVGHEGPIERVVAVLQQPDGEWTIVNVTHSNRGFDAANGTPTLSIGRDPPGRAPEGRDGIRVNRKDGGEETEYYFWSSRGGHRFYVSSR